MRGYLYVADENGAEIAGSRRSLANVRRGDGQFRALEAELKRLAAEDCTVRYSETEKLIGAAKNAGGVALGLIFLVAVVSALPTLP